MKTSDSSAVVIGSGIMGCGIAAIFLAAGWHTQLVVRRKERGPECQRLVMEAAGQCAPEPDDQKLHLHDSVTGVNWESVDIVIETIVEDLSVKQKLFAELDALVPSTVPIASNTSGFRISEIAEGCATRHRMAHAHFFMPAHLIPLVELAKAEFTSNETLDQLHDIFQSVQRVPVRINSDAVGLLANRLQHALMREAWSIVQAGLATPDDVDTAVRFGFGFRYLAAGPILQKEFSGLDTQLVSAATIYPTLCNDTKPAAVLREIVEAGHFGVKTGRGVRDWPEDKVRVEKARYERALAAATELLMRDGLPGDSR